MENNAIIPLRLLTFTCQVVGNENMICGLMGAVWAELVHGGCGEGGVEGRGGSAEEI